MADGYVAALRRGELAELLGAKALEHDKVQRVLQIRPAAEHLAASMTADQRRLFEAFARGVNSYINSHQTICRPSSGC